MRSFLGRGEVKVVELRPLTYLVGARYMTLAVNSDEINWSCRTLAAPQHLRDFWDI